MGISGRVRRAACAPVLLLVAGVLAACGSLWTPAPEAPAAAPAPASSTRANPATRPPGASEITIYLPRLFEDDSLGLQGVIRAVVPSADPVRDAIEALIRGPDGDERAADYQYALDRRTRVVNVRMESGTATVELDEQIRRVHGRPFSELVYWSIVFTLTAVPGVERVALIQNGAPLAQLGDPPFTVPAAGTRAAAPAWAHPQ